MQIQVQNLTKNFDHTKVLDNISFSIDKGQVVGFLGPNGAGKTTTMRILTGFLAPTAGEVKISETSVKESPLSARKRIGYLPENNPLYQEMRIYEYLSFISASKNIQKASPEIRRVIHLCGLSDRISQPIAELSKGYRQRVGLAQALLGDPEILLLDEPTSGLDPNQIIEIRNLIKRIGKAKTIILSTHILSEVQQSCNHVIIISKGKIVASGTTEELTKQAQGKIQIRAVIQGPGLEIKQKLEGMAGAENVRLKTAEDGDENIYLLDTLGSVDIRKHVFDICVHSGWTLLELERKTTSFEDVFAMLTK